MRGGCAKGLWNGQVTVGAGNDYCLRLLLLKRSDGCASLMSQYLQALPSTPPLQQPEYEVLMPIMLCCSLVQSMSLMVVDQPFWPFQRCAAGSSERRLLCLWNVSWLHSS